MNSISYAPLTKLTCVLLGLAISACAGSTGADGAMGAMGTTGADGTAGAAGAAGPKGDPGPSNLTLFRTTVATPGANLAAANKVDLGTWGPFTLRGYCYAGGGNVAVAEFYLATTEATSKYNNYYSASNGTVTTATPVRVGYGGTGTFGGATTTLATTVGMNGPFDGQFAAWSTDLTTYITGSVTSAVYLNGAANSACQFAGFVSQSP